MNNGTVADGGHVETAAERKERRRARGSRVSFHSRTVIADEWNSSWQCSPTTILASPSHDELRPHGRARAAAMGVNASSHLATRLFHDDATQRDSHRSNDTLESTGSYRSTSDNDDDDGDEYSDLDGYDDFGDSLVGAGRGNGQSRDNFDRCWTLTRVARLCAPRDPSAPHGCSTRRLVVLVIMAVALFSGSFALVSLHRPSSSLWAVDLEREPTASNVTREWIVSSTVAGLAVGSPIAGILTGIYGSRVVLGGALVIVSLLTFLSPLAERDLAAFLCVRVVLGTAASAFTPAAHHFVAQWCRAHEISSQLSLLLAMPMTALVASLFATPALHALHTALPSLLPAAILLVAALAIFMLTTARPEDNHWLTNKERLQITGKFARIICVFATTYIKLTSVCGRPPCASVTMQDHSPYTRALAPLFHLHCHPCVLCRYGTHNYVLSSC